MDEARILTHDLGIVLVAAKSLGVVDEWAGLCNGISSDRVLDLWRGVSSIDENWLGDERWIITWGVWESISWHHACVWCACLPQIASVFSCWSGRNISAHHCHHEDGHYLYHLFHGCFLSLFNSPTPHTQLNIFNSSPQWETEPVCSLWLFLGK